MGSPFEAGVSVFCDTPRAACFFVFQGFSYRSRIVSQGVRRSFFMPRVRAGGCRLGGFRLSTSIRVLEPCRCLMWFFAAGVFFQAAGHTPERDRMAEPSAICPKPVAQQVGEVFDSLEVERHESRCPAIGMMADAVPCGRKMSIGMDNESPRWENKDEAFPEPQCRKKSWGA